MSRFTKSYTHVSNKDTGVISTQLKILQKTRSPETYVRTWYISELNDSFKSKNSDTDKIYHNFKENLHHEGVGILD